MNSDSDRPLFPAGALGDPPPNFKFHQEVKFGEIWRVQKSAAPPPDRGGPLKINPSQAALAQPLVSRRTTAADAAPRFPGRRAGNSNFTKVGGGAHKTLISLSQTRLGVGEGEI